MNMIGQHVSNAKIDTTCQKLTDSNFVIKFLMTVWNSSHQMEGVLSVYLLWSHQTLLVNVSWIQLVQMVNTSIKAQKPAKEEQFKTVNSMLSTEAIAWNVLMAINSIV